MTLEQDQRERLQKITGWGRRIRETLQPVLDLHGNRVHFRPSSGGVAMVGLLPDRPQRGRSKIGNLDRLVEPAVFEAMFGTHCRDITHGRVTGEKALQSFLIREAYTNGRHLVSINDASLSSDEPVSLTFVTDEIALPVAGGKKTV